MNRVIVGIVISAGLMCGGCIIMPPTHYVLQSTPYYLDGPPVSKEGMGSLEPDGWLTRGDKVWEISTETKSGYKRVWISFLRAASVFGKDILDAEEYEKRNAKKK